MTDPQIAVAMLGIFILVILLGFPIAFTLMGMAVGFGYYAYFDISRIKAFGTEDYTFWESLGSYFSNRIFDLLVNQTYSVMANDVLTAVPLFLFMGYIVERANIVDRLFNTLNIAARNLPGSMAIAALATCALFATATGIIGAVVTLMGLLAYPAMLRARYDTSFASGVICAGGCLGILIPPSIMLIVYAATSNVSVVKLYAGAIIPGFMLAGLYMIYVVGRAMLNPSIAPKPRPEDMPDVIRAQVWLMVATSFFPLAFLILSVLGAILFGLATPSEAASVGAIGGMLLAVAYRLGSIARGTEKPPWPALTANTDDRMHYFIGYGVVAATALFTVYIAVWAFIRKITGIDLPTEPRLVLWPGVAPTVACIIAALTAIGIWPSALQPRNTVIARVFAFAGQGAIYGALAGALYIALFKFGGTIVTAPFGTDDNISTVFADHEFTWFGIGVGMFTSALFYAAWKMMDRDRLRESIYLTVRTSAMVCWLFVGSWTFSSVFSYMGGENLIKDFVLGLNLSPLQFLLLAQLIIFLLGWPLEWSEIIIIFIPIFLPMLPNFGVDPLFFGILVALNLQTSFLTPPMAMAAYYLKGVAPPHVQLMEIFKGVMPFLMMVFLAMFLLYQFPGIALWLPEQIYGK